jgi:hypothetical protein
MKLLVDELVDRTAKANNAHITFILETDPDDKYGCQVVSRAFSILSLLINVTGLSFDQ